MIVGAVNAQFELEFHLPVRDQLSQEHDVVTILDTGFTGELTLPAALIATLGLKWRTRSPAILANGQVHQFDVYAATIIWDGVPRRILIQAIDNVPLLGMSLLVDHDLRVRVQIGGAAEIVPVP